MAYKVLTGFTDKNTLIPYLKGDEYPGHNVSEARLKELTTKNNATEKVLVEEIKEEKQETPEEKPEKEITFPRHTGGGWYELSNGEKVQGSEEAKKAEAELK